jgi:hypothetical protein
MLWKNASNRLLLRSFPVQVTAWTVSACGMIVRGRFKAGLNIFRGLIEAFMRFSSLKRSTTEVNDQVEALLIKRIGIWYFVRKFFRYVKEGLHG